MLGVKLAVKLPTGCMDEILTSMSFLNLRQIASRERLLRRAPGTSTGAGFGRIAKARLFGRGAGAGFGRIAKARLFDDGAGGDGARRSAILELPLVAGAVTSV
jgi:hypothetical protein